jgi:hypothetical protein
VIRIEPELALRIAYNPTYGTAVEGPTPRSPGRYADSVISGMLHVRITLPCWARRLSVTWVPDGACLMVPRRRLERRWPRSWCGSVAAGWRLGGRVPRTNRPFGAEDALQPYGRAALVL